MKKSSCGTKKYAAGGAVMRSGSTMKPGARPGKMPAYKKGGMVKKAK